MTPMGRLVWGGAMAIVLCGGCGGSSATNAAVSEFSARDAVLFDDGIDFVTSAVSLDGPWRDEWVDDLQDRTRAADGIAVVVVRTVRTDEDPNGNVTHRLLVTSERTIAGAFPKGEFPLTTRPGSPGFRTVAGRIDRLQGERLLAFLKWVQPERGERTAHWHLAPASEEVVAATLRIAGKSSPEGDRN